MNSDAIREIEKEIDLDFSKSPLNQINYSQALWTILSVMEDSYLKATQIKPLEPEYMHAHIDALVSAVNHPIKSIYNKNPIRPEKIIHELIDDHYGWSYDWIEKAIIYDNFCAIFPLYWKDKISIQIKGNELSVEDWRSKEPRYEVYNRLTRKDGDSNEVELDLSAVFQIVDGNFQAKKDRFDLNLNPKLVNQLFKIYTGHTQSRYKIPGDWECCHFSFHEFKKVYTTIQAILLGRYVSRCVLAMNGLKGMGYADSVWVLDKSQLVKRLSRYTGLKTEKVKKIITYLTFGEVGIRNPDIAIQPIIDLKNGSLALAPFIFLNSNSERNFCVLLNQIPEEKAIYSKLTQQKEDILKSEIFKDIQDLGFRLESGQLSDTNLDLAIIDDNKKICIAIELKWFIEPAEIREILDRSKELEKGVSQAKKIEQKFKNREKQLIEKVLKIGNDYELVTVVGTRNWIGNYFVQSDSVPIIKIKHLVQELKDKKCLISVSDWLKNRDYLPKESIHYEILDIPLHIGKWKTTWYGIKPVI